MNATEFSSADQPHHNEREQALRDKLVTEAFETLRGHFDGLVILGTFVLEDGSTSTISRTDGNWFAINGAIEHFLSKRRASAHFEAEDKHRAEAD